MSTRKSCSLRRRSMRSISSIAHIAIDMTSSNNSITACDQHRIFSTVRMAARERTRIMSRQARRTKVTAISLAIGVFTLQLAAAQDWPSRPVTMVVPLAAGSGIDVLGRIFAPRLSELLGQQVIVENVGGAGGMTGARHSRPQSDAFQASALQCRDRLRTGRANCGTTDRANCA